MKKQIGTMMCVMFVGLGAAALLAAQSGEDEMPVFQMSEKDESCIEVAAGKPFALRFPSSPGTGYAWEFAGKLDKELLEFLAEKREEPAAMRLGGSETVVWTFQALAAGKTEISMKYVRPWEKDAPAARKHVFKVRIR